MGRDGYKKVTPNIAIMETLVTAHTRQPQYIWY